MHNATKAAAPTIDSVASRTCAASIAAIAIVALVLQYLLLLQQAAATIGAPMATLRFFSYFTILSNVLVALACAGAALRRPGRLGSAWLRGLAALCIGVTGCVYATVLVGLVAMDGLQWWVDRTLHYALPLLYVAWWLLGTPHGTLGWRDVGRWLLFPLGYLAWIALRVTLIERWFPYPFLDVDALGTAAVLRNALLVAVAFSLGGAALLSADRWLGRRRAAHRR